MFFPQNTQVPGLSGERFQVVYRIAGDSTRVKAIATEICFDQTVELPEEIVPPGEVRDVIVGQIEKIEQSDYSAAVTISYPIETASTGLPQLLNVLFGNISLMPGIQVMALHLSGRILIEYTGSNFGISGLRLLLKAFDRPLLSASIRPMGLVAEALAQVAYQLALGGIDIVKDDHGLANQPFAPYEARVWRCAQAVAKANRETGVNCIYAPNITAPVDQIIERALFAKRAGAGALMISYGLTGFDALRMLTSDKRIDLPVIAHPALFGSFVTTPTSGISPYVLFGQLMRLAGADASIFVNYGGRYPYTPEQCQSVAEGCVVPMGHLPAIFPVPSSGLTLERLPELREFYGRDVIFHIGTGLYRSGHDLTANARLFAQQVQ
jgi:ribulose-bisphosphate carboxylase large chain